MQGAYFPAPALCEGCPRSARTLAEAVAGWSVQRAEAEGKVMLRGALSLVLSLCIQRKNNKTEKDCFLSILKIESKQSFPNIIAWSKERTIN